MQFIIYLAPLFTIYLLMQRDTREALIRGYLPILLLLPDCYHAMTPGLPDPSFNQAAILPVFLAAIWTQRQNWQPSLTDLLVIGFASCVAYSEYSNTGYAEAQNLMFAMLASVLAPYLCARWCLRSLNDDIACARVFVICCVIVSALSVYQFRFGINLWHLLLGPFFPGQGDGWVTTFRYGVARIAGPYSHAILAGIMLAMAWRLARWLQWGACWEDKIRHFRLPGSKTQWVNGLLLLGMIMTIARGPWLGSVVGGILLWVSHATDRSKRLKWVLAIFVVGGVIGQLTLDAYLDIKPGTVMTQSQESAFYRKELMDKYQAIALEHATFGWGRNTWPKVGGMESIDNYYLLLALMHGIVALTILLFVMAWMTTRLIKRGLNEPAGPASLPFTFAGIIAMVFVSLGTVYLGEQPMPAFFFIIGWAEAYLQRQHAPVLVKNTTQKPSTTTSFRHVMS
ncbi:O-antigen ligase family protein [Chitinibacter bivalviorum]|uniref:O-antigen ligase family protein n=1 Tax=Chitinibacter bivalviorum TaxID=2739434 RepID=A0A7H9BHV6_9NEIS|nr:O-antigen ligase family protein [Chitinibacter bivalviorum]QLG87788.1 O-antigen ligase family protein [Chitinibacter bivalviorum]